MEITNDNQDLQLKSFDLGENGGGPQMILAHKAVSEKEHYVFTLGNGPKKTEEQAEPVDSKNTAGKQILSSIRDRFMHKKDQNQTEQEQDDLDNFKLRCFKLSKVEGKKYLVEEYVTPEGVCNVARLFNDSQEKENN